MTKSGRDCREAGYKMVRMFLQFSLPDLDCQLFFQSAPMVVDSHCDRDDFHIHFCCNFTQTVLSHP